MRTSAQRTLAPGQCIGPFVLLEPLGSGGSGRVWAAVRVGQLGFTKRMAVKLLHVEKLGSERAVQRFEREARLGARLTHPNIRAVHDLNSHEGRPYMAMRWVDTSLEELLEGAPGHALASEVTCWVGLQCCDALTAAHAHVDARGVARPIIHRDVAPGNILLSAEGHVLLSDLAAPADEDSGSLGTSDTRFFGNLAYASPEALNQQELDGRADVYSLGCVLYQCLCGALPFEADNEHSLMYQVLKRDIVDVRERAPHVPEALAAVVRRAMARERDDRFASADAMGSALSECVESLGAFMLEERTTGLIRQVLGERLRAREAAMHAAYQRYSLSQSGLTETLPIRQSYEGDALGGDTRGSVALTTPVGGVVAPMLPERSRGRRLGVGLALLALSVAVYVRSGGPARSEATKSETPSAATAPRTESETRRLEPTRSTPVTSDSVPAPSAAAPGNQTAPGTTAEAAVTTREPAAPIPAQQREKRSNKPTKTAAENAVPASPPAPHRTDPAPSSPADAFQFDRTNPYRKPPAPGE